MNIPDEVRDDDDVALQRRPRDITARRALVSMRNGSSRRCAPEDRVPASLTFKQEAMAKLTAFPGAPSIRLGRCLRRRRAPAGIVPAVQKNHRTKIATEKNRATFYRSCHRSSIQQRSKTARLIQMTKNFPEKSRNSRSASGGQEHKTQVPGMGQDAAAVYLTEECGVPISARTLQKRRVVGGGPRFRKINGHIIYGPPDLDAWADEQLARSPLVTSTSEYDD